MAGVTISYKGSLIASMTSAGTKTLTTSGQYCEDNITVGYSAPSLLSVTINTGNLLSQNTTFNSSNLVLYENNNFSKSQAVPSYVKWFDSFIPINLNEKIHLYMNLSFLCSDIDETIIIDCDYTVSSNVTSLSFTSSSLSSNIKYFNIYYYSSNELRFGFAKNNGNTEDVLITGQIIITKVVDGIDTINLNLIDNPLYLNIYKSLAYRSAISASALGVSEWCNSLTTIDAFRFAGLTFSGSLYFNNVNNVGQYAFAFPWAGIGVSVQSLRFTVNFLNSQFSSFSNNVFMSNGTLEGIYAPYVKIISNFAFAFCRNLVSVNFPLCTYISMSAFLSCISLITVSFPSCTTVEYGAFSGCTKLLTINFPSCTTINGYAFCGCSSLTTVSFPICTTISRGVFLNCTSLITVSFPSCTAIDDYAFSGCTNLTTINFPSCTTINGYAFSNCKKLETISFPVCTTISSYAFCSCTSLTAVNFPSCTIIGTSAFSSCAKLTTVNFPLCTTISNYAFYNCSKLETISFPVCTTINSYAFRSCTSLATISFPSCITIDYGAFSGCTKLSEAYFMGSSIVTALSPMFQLTPIVASSYLGYFGSIYVPASLLASYKTATNWALYSGRMVGI